MSYKTDKRTVAKMFKGKLFTTAKASDVRITRKVNRAINRNIETKTYPRLTDLKVNAGVAGIFYDLSSVAQGATAITRTGDKVKQVKLDLNLHAEQAAGSSDTIRFILFKWHPDTGTAGPTTAQLLDSPGAVTDRQFLMPVSSTHAGNFTILKDVSFTTVKTSDSEEVVRNYKLFGKKYTFGINYTAAAITGTQHVHLFVVSSCTTPGDQTYSYASKMYFKDG